MSMSSNISALDCHSQTQCPNVDFDSCTLATCNIDLAHIRYLPNVAANTLFVVIFGAALGLQILFGIRSRIWPYMGPMIPGLILEVLGYVGRLMMHHNPFNFSAFLLYLIPLTIGPAFFTAAIYICLGKIVVIYGEDISRFRPRTYSYIFMTCDLIALILQAAGGAVSSIAKPTDQAMSDAGVNTMIAGLAFQVAALTLFTLLAADFAMRVRKCPKALLNENTETFRHSWRWMGFLLCLSLAVLTIYIRSCFRVAELQGGFTSDLANNQVALMILESAMVSFAVICLTIGHPGLVLGRRWSTFTSKAHKQPGYKSVKGIKEPMSSSTMDLEGSTQYSSSK